MKKTAHSLALLGALTSTLNPAFSASNLQINLAQTSGKVLVSQGTGFGPYLMGAPLKAGDKVLVGNESSAVLAFADCSVELASGQLFIVPASAPCSKNETRAVVNGLFVTPVSQSATESDLDRVILRHSNAQVRAANAGDVEAASCLSQKVAKLQLLRNFWARNPGVDPTSIIDELDFNATNCSPPQADPVQKASKSPKRMTKRVTDIEVIEQPAPVGKSMAAAGGMTGSTMALVGVGAVAIVGLGTLVALSGSKSNSVAVSAK
jgi:hypothetical protein